MPKIVLLGSSRALDMRERKAGPLINNCEKLIIETY